MFIVPMSPAIHAGSMNSIGSDKTESGSGNELGFKELFQDVVNNVQETEAATERDAYNLSIGNMDDPHTMIINAAKADLALQTMVQLRNKVLDTYTEIMRVNV